jgi:hypothetical protein
MLICSGRETISIVDRLIKFGQIGFDQPTTKRYERTTLGSQIYGQGLKKMVSIPALDSDRTDQNGRQRNIFYI